MKSPLLKFKASPIATLKGWISKQSFQDNQFSLKQLITFGIAFGIVGSSILYFVLAVPTTKIWDTQADFDSGTKTNITTNSSGSFNLTPSSGGAVDLHLDFEDPAWPSASNLECPNLPRQFHTDTAIESADGGGAIRQGTNAGRFEAKSGDLWTGNNTVRCLANYGSSSETAGKDYYYAMSMYFPATITGNLLWELHGPATIYNQTSCGIAPFRILKDGLGTGLQFALQTGNCTIGTGYPHTEVVTIPGLEVQPTRTWIDFIVHIKFSEANDGVVELWQRTGSNPFPTTPQISYANIPTTQFINSLNIHNVTLYTEMGLYRGTSTAPLVADVVYHDGYRRGSSYAAVAADFPGGTGSPTSTTYPSTGSLTLPFDAGTGVHFSNFTPTLAAALPAGTSVTYEARSSCDQTTWSAWGAVNSVPDGRYLQLRANLATTDSTKTPTIDKLAVDYDAVSGVCQTAPVVNLAPNSSFETDPLVDYFNTAVTGATYSWATDAANTGTHALKIVSTAPSLSRWLSQTTKIPVTPGKVYVASAYLKTQAAANTTLSMNFWDSSSAIIGGTSDSSLVNGTTNWTNATVSATAPAGAAYVRAEFRLNGAGTIWADDLSVAEAAPAVPPPVNTAAPIISGATTVGQILTSSNGTWSNSPTSFGYQWQACDISGNNCISISGASGSTYLLTTTEAGKTIKVVVTAANGTGSTPATSAATAVVATPPPPVVPAPTISQNITAGQTLTGTVTWTATVTANTSSIRQIVFAMDGNTNNTTVASPGPYERVLDTRTLTDGTHALGLTVTLTDGTVVYAPYQIGNVLVDNADHIPPTTPTNLAGTPVASPPTVNLTWTASTDNVAVTAYKIYRGVGAATPTLLNTTTTAATTYSDTSVTSATNYTYQITAVDAAGNQSAGSVAVVVNTPDITPPTTPTSLSIVTTSVPTTLDLTWAASYDAVGVTGYELYRGQGSATPALLTTLGNVTSYSDTTVSANTNYSYYLKAIDAANNASIQSTTFSITTPKLPDTTVPIVALTTPVANAEVKGNNVSISATATDNEGVSSVQFYLNYDGNPANNKLGPLLTSGTSGAYSYTWDTTTLANTTYTLTAIATDTSNNTATSTNVTVTVNNPVVLPPTPPDTTAPSVPTGLTGSAASETTITLSWGASADNTGGSGLSGYLIYRNGEAVPIAATDQLSYLDINLTASTDYTYTIAAIDNLGNQSAKSSPLKVTTLASPVVPAPSPEPTPVPVPVIPVTPPTTSQPTTPATPSLSAKHGKGDVNNNDKVDIIDLSILLSHFNTRPGANTNGDVNGDGQVNVIDLSILLSNYGR